MSATNTIMVGWKQAFTGREKVANESFGRFVEYLGKLKKDGYVDSFEPVILDPNGGNLGGFFLVRGDQKNLDKVRATDDWKEWVVFGQIHMQGFFTVGGAVGEGVSERMTRYHRAVENL